MGRAVTATRLVMRAAAVAAVAITVAVVEAVIPELLIMELAAAVDHLIHTPQM